MGNARESRLDQLRKRQKESKDNAGKSPYGFDNYFELPDGIPQWSAKGDEKGVTHYIDLLPFKFGDRVPTNIPSQRVSPGDWDYKCQVYIHRNVGQNNRVVLCPLGNYGDPCPICEHKNDLLAEETDEDVRKKIREQKGGKHYVLYNVWVHDNQQEEEKGVQVWSVPHFFFEDKIKDLESEDGSEVIVGATDNEYGRQIKFTVEKKGKTNTEYKSHGFKKRVGYEIPKEIEEEGAYQLDSFLKPVMSYDELKALYWGKTEKTEETEETTAADPSPTRRTLKMKQDIKKETSEEKQETKDETKEEEVKEEKQTRSLKREADEKQEVVEEKKQTASTSCPHNHTFGTDCLKKPECNDCDDTTYRACQAKKKELAKKIA